MTTGELLDRALSYYLNAGDSSVVHDLAQRKRAHHFLEKTALRVWQAAPFWFRHADTTVSLTAGTATLPAGFGGIGAYGRIYVAGQRFRPLSNQPVDRIKYLIENQRQSGPPWMWALDGVTALGLPKILTYPTSSETLDILAYDRKMPELIDRPMAPALAVGADGALTGTVTGLATYVTALGETEAGEVSLSVVLAAKKVDWSDIPTWWGRTVTSRKLYRLPLAGGTTSHKLVTTLADNTTTVYAADEALDVALGADAPLPAAAVTGLEQFPEEFHLSAIYDGVVSMLATGHGDGRDRDFDAKWHFSVKRMWEECQQGQGTLKAMPAFPGVSGGHPMWSRYSPP